MPFFRAWLIQTFVGCWSVCALRRQPPAVSRPPIVYVHEFLPGFPGNQTPSLESMGNFSMNTIYGSAVCVGDEDETFIADSSLAPKSHCRFHAADTDTQYAMQKHQNDDFDEYALERIMLGKWMESPLRCQRGPEWCRAHADIVVVPSLVFHRLLQQGFFWAVKHPPASKARPQAAAFWSLLESMFHQPENGYTPYIVLHSAYAWDWPGYNVFLQALAFRTPSFIDRVVLPSTGSNLQKTERLVFGETWSDNGFVALQRRAELRQQGSSTEGVGPIIFTMPYPTSILHESRFTDSDGEYSADATRRIKLSMLGARKRDKYGANWIRPVIMNQLGNASRRVYVEEDLRLVCSETGKGQGAACGLGRRPNMWTVAANSMFCLEPAGDTLCRSHFYVAALSGCIPVIIDGGHTLYESSPETWWAWRRPREVNDTLASLTPDETIPNVDEFTVRFNATQIKDGHDFIQELVDMPDKDPERFQKLRRGLDSIAPLMRYSKESCSTYPLADHPYACRDAFSAFQALLAQEVEAGMAEQGHQWSRKHQKTNE